MSQQVVIDLFRNAVATTIIVVSPLLAVAIVVGFVIAIFQAMTQINEQTMVFAPKILAVFLAMIIFGSWILTQLTEFTKRLFESILSLV